MRRLDGQTPEKIAVARGIGTATAFRREQDAIEKLAAVLARLQVDRATVEGYLDAAPAGQLGSSFGSIAMDEKLPLGPPWATTPESLVAGR